MIDLLCDPLPETVEADGQEYPILTDFRDWLRFSGLIADKEVTPREKLLLLPEWLEEPVPLTGALTEALLGFWRARELEPEPLYPPEETDEAAPRPPVFDWCIDARYVLGDFRRYYGIDLLSADYLHWWAFKSLFAALPDESMCQKRIAYRSCDLSQIKNRAERTRIARIQRQIALPYEYDDEMIGAVLWGTI